MTEVIFLTSNQGQQAERVRTISERLKHRLPDLTVRIVDAAAHPELLAKHKLRYGPGVIVDGQLEYVGEPRFSMLVDRVLQVRERRANPRNSGDKPGPEYPVSPGPAPPALPTPP